MKPTGNFYEERKESKTKNVFESNAGEKAEELIDAYLDEEMTKEQVIEAAQKIGGEVEKIVKNFF